MDPAPGPPAGRSVLAHGLGGADDLPIPAELAIVGATTALAVSFVILALAWQSPRYGDPDGGRLAPAWLSGLVDSAAFAWVARAFGVFLFAWAAIAALLGQDLLTNPFFGMVYVLLWVGIVPMSLLLGRFWRAISPVRTINLLIARLAGTHPDRGMRTYPEHLGAWPAALGLFAFVWLELVYPSSTELGPVRLFFAVYVAVMLIGGALFGARFYERADPFEVYSTLVARLSVWGRDSQGRLRLRSPLANLDLLRPRPGLVAVVAVLLGSTAFDSFSSANAWRRFTQDAGASTTLLDTAALVAFCLGVGLLLVAATAALPAPGVERRAMPALFAHSVVPIVVGYIFAHYLTYLVETGQATLIQMSDPLGTGANLLGTGDLSVNYFLSFHPTLLAWLKVFAVVAGHVLGVIAAHERAVRVLPRRHQLTGQLPLLAVMVGFTAGGLYLLFSA